MITIRDLRKSYGSKKVLDGLSMTVNAGEIYGFLGENGAGKTTTMNIITGLLAKDSGSIFIDGHPDGQMETLSIGYLPESPEFFEYMTCREYFRYIASACGYEGDVEKRTGEVISLIGLAPAIDQKIKGFSRGMKQRVGIGCALYSGKEIILLDEPTSALDPQGRADVMQIIARLKEMGKTVILSTHILSDVERVADRVGILHQGTLRLEGKVSDLLRENAAHIIGFEANRSPAVREKIAALPFAEKVEGSGSSCYVTVSGDLDAGNRELFRLLADNGLTVQRYELARPTLEQIYLKVVKAHAAANSWS